MGEPTPIRCGCGGPVSTDYICVDTIEDDILVIMPVYRVFCHKCGISTPCAYKSRQDAIRAWNIAMSGNYVNSKGVQNE